MLTRRDELLAQRFENRRTLAALVTGRPEVAEPPMRRLSVTTVSGIMIAIVIAAGFAVLGVIRPTADDAWRRAGTIIVERETGARFVLIDNVLHPVRNDTSAVLAVGMNQSSRVVLVSRAQLAAARLGPRIGIDGLPDSLPAAAELVSSPWTVCSRQQLLRGDRAEARTGVLIGADAGDEVGATPLPPRSAILVRTASAPTLYLLYGGRRLAIGSSAVATALGLQAQPMEVGTAFLDAVPPGPALRAPDVPHIGRPTSVTVVGRRPLVGQLLHVTDNDTYFVALADGVLQLDPVETALLRTLPIGAGGRLAQPVDITESVALALAPSTGDGPALADRLAGLPDRLPPVASAVQDARSVCAVYRTGARPTFSVPSGQPTSAGAGTVTESQAARRGLADEVELRPGSAALVGAGSELFVIADSGRKYPVHARAVLACFGYARAPVARLRAPLLSLVPTGPALDPERARRAGR